MTTEWRDVAGSIGILFILVATLMLQTGRVQSNSALFCAINRIRSDGKHVWWRTPTRAFR